MFAIQDWAIIKYQHLIVVGNILETAFITALIFDNRLVLNGEQSANALFKMIL